MLLNVKVISLRKNRFNFYDIHDHTTKQKIIVDIPFSKNCIPVTKKLNSKDPIILVGLDRLQTRCPKSSSILMIQYFIIHTRDVPKIISQKSK